MFLNYVGGTIEMKNMLLVIGLIPLIFSCGKPAHERIKDADTTSMGQNLNDTVEKHVLDRRVETFIDSIVSTNDKVLVSYTTRCWIEDCAPNGFIYASNGSTRNLYFFRLKKLYQRISTKDSSVFVGTMFQYQLSTVSKELVAQLEQSMEEFRLGYVPVHGELDVSHDKPVYVWIKDGARSQKAKTLQSTLFLNDSGKYVHTAKSFWKIDSMIKVRFDKTNMRVLDANADVGSDR